jgi:hypothetical protein
MMKDEMKKKDKKNKNPIVCVLCSLSVCAAAIDVCFVDVVFGEKQTTKRSNHNNLLFFFFCVWFTQVDNFFKSYYGNVLCALKKR